MATYTKTRKKANSRKKARLNRLRKIEGTLLTHKAPRKGSVKKLKNTLRKPAAKRKVRKALKVGR